MTRVRVEQVAVSMRDGTRLAADVVVPAHGDPRPAVLVRTPYGRQAAHAAHDPVGFTRDGWAVVVQDVRGRFGSEGQFEPFHQERRDGADTLAWVAAQPWCDGRIVGMGASYLATSQWLAAAEKPDGLVAAAPVLSGQDVRDCWMYEGGAFQLGFATSWAASMAATRPDGQEGGRGEPATVTSDLRRLVSMPLHDHPLRERFAPFARWLDAGDDAYWQPLSLGDGIRKLDLPTFQVAGWYDIFCESTLASHAAMVEGAATDYARGAQRLIIGPWAHTSMFAARTAEFLFTASADGIASGIPEQMLTWLRAAADRRPVDGGVDAYVLFSGEWLHLPSWPPPAEPLRLFLSSARGANSVAGDGTLERDPPAVASADRFRYDPHDPVPTRGGRTLHALHPLAGPVDQRPVEARDDVLVYTSDPLPDDLVIAGPVTATVVFETDGRSADVTVKLVDVHPDGRAINVLDSIRRERFDAGCPRRVEVHVGSVAARLRAGHRIRLEVSSSNFPRFDRNPSTGRAPAEADDLRPATQTVHLGGYALSHVTLPVHRTS